MENGKIDLFRGEHAYLSNFYGAPVFLQGLTYRNAEAAFQAQKTEDAGQRAAFTSLDAKAAKRAGRHVALRTDWEAAKVSIMAHVISAKFRQNPDLARKLMATGNVTLIESNTWGDTFWGVSGGNGQNVLGRLLMSLRRALQEESQKDAMQCAIRLCIPNASGKGSDCCMHAALYYGGTGRTRSDVEITFRRYLEAGKRAIRQGLRLDWDPSDAILSACERMHTEEGIPYRIMPSGYALQIDI